MSSPSLSASRVFFTADIPVSGLARLLENDPVSAYWMGFIFADGHLGKHRLKIALSSKDANHLTSLADWLGDPIHVTTSRDGSVAYLARQDRVVVPAIRERFDLRPRKTYEPPTRLPYDDETLLRCWMVGYIDGDGEVRRQTGRRTALLHTVAHLSWESLITSVSENLGFGVVRRREVRGSTYVALTCHRHNEIVALRQFARTYDLPVLERKWGKVDESYEAPAQTDGRVRREIEEHLLLGGRTKDIAKKLGRSAQQVSNVRGALGLPDARKRTTSTQEGGRYE